MAVNMWSEPVETVAAQSITVHMFTIHPVPWLPRATWRTVGEVPRQPLVRALRRLLHDYRAAK